MRNSNFKVTFSYYIAITLTFVMLCGLIYYAFLYKPKNSLELYQAISLAENFEEAQELTLEGYEDNFNKEDFDFINRMDKNANSVSQLTLLEYDEKTYVIVTSPGTPKLKILSVEELPLDIRDYFIKLLE